MSECLVTKLKSSVNNRELQPLGGIVLNVSFEGNYTENSYFRMAASTADKPIKIRCNGEGYFRASATSEDQKDTEGYSGQTGYVYYYSGNLGSIYPSNGDYDIFIENKYELSGLSFNGGNVGTINIPMTLKEIAAYSPNLTYLDLTNASIKDSELSDLKGLSNLTTLSLRKKKMVGGDLDAVSSLKLTRLELGGTNVYGKVESLGVGRTSGETMEIQGNEIITFDGSPLNNYWSYIVTFGNGVVQSCVVKS